jgi:hypothetical protein
VAPYLTRITHSHVYVASDPEETASSFQMYAPLIYQVPQMYSLGITTQYGEGFSDVSRLSLARHKGDSTQYKLRELYFTRLKIADQHANLFGNLDPMVLTVIELIDCVDTQPLLNSLAKSFTDNCPALYRFVLELPVNTVERDAGGVGRDVGNFLLSFAGLHTLMLGMSTYALVVKESIVKHAKTPVRLGVNAHHSNSSRYYKQPDLVTILQSCSKLEELAIHIDTPVPACWTTLCHNLLGQFPVAMLVSSTEAIHSIVSTNNTPASYSYTSHSVRLTNSRPANYRLE